MSTFGQFLRVTTYVIVPALDVLSTIFLLESRSQKRYFSLRSLAVAPVKALSRRLGMRLILCPSSQGWREESHSGPR
ncbi:hypothetical protein Trco_004696 [Trichoderma cornu-damae]|uniref:Uncharacterized protein n=1 Tax=Trichoderma cornu-damae TaxID=654480 RepID=A0A9P8TUP0_9HYPO|nr:hypothetical protein Trco_004696 [Trichoderma cornu-damae]